MKGWREPRGGGYRIHKKHLSLGPLSYTLKTMNTHIHTCTFCGFEFKARRGAKFCSDTCRVKAWQSRAIDHYHACFYCGSPADTLDHIPPKAARDRIIETGLADSYPFSTVDACRECNATLGAKALWTATERKAEIAACLRHRNRALLASPDWQESDLDHLGETLRAYTVSQQAHKAIVQARIDWAETSPLDQNETL